MAVSPGFPTIRDLPSSPWRSVCDAFLNLVYPEICFICGEPVARRQDCGLCESCWRKVLALRIEAIAAPRCPSCGVPLPGFAAGTTQLCLDCVRRPPLYTGARSVACYATEIRQVIHELKFAGRATLSELLAPLLADAFCASWQKDDFDFIVAIPLHARRRRERGFNQSGLLAWALGRRIGLKALPVLRRTAATRPQVGLTNAQRARNVRNAFRCARPGQVKDRRILLIDDVMTTGATVESATRTLLRAGARQVSVLTVARALR